MNRFISDKDYHSQNLETDSRSICPSKPNYEDMLHRYKMKPLMAIKGPIRYSSNDWVECLATLPSSRILQRTKWAILSNFMWTTFLVIMYKSFKLTFAFPSIVHSIVGSALSLLLVFRTNSSYDRFWEARKLWSSLIHSSRELGRLTYLHLSKDVHERIAQLIISFAIALKQHLQGNEVLKLLLFYFL